MPVCSQTFAILGGYQSNNQYDAYLSMFELNDSKTDVIFLGDSITARGRFEEFFPDVDLLNRGIGSDVSEGVLNRMDEIESHSPKAIFLMIGINDIGNHVDTENTIENVKNIVEECKTLLPECEVFLQSVLPVETIALSEIQDLNVQYKELALEYENCTYVDLYDSFITENGEVETGLLSTDGVHLNGAGYEAWVDVIAEYIAIYRKE